MGGRLSLDGELSAADLSLLMPTSGQPETETFPQDPPRAYPSVRVYQAASRRRRGRVAEGHMRVYLTSN